MDDQVWVDQWRARRARQDKLSERLFMVTAGVVLFLFFALGIVVGVLLK